MVRPDRARDDAIVIVVAVAELKFAAFGDGFGDGVEEAEVGVFRREGAEGEDTAEVGDGVEFAIVELAGEFLEGDAQGFSKGVPP